MFHMTFVQIAFKLIGCRGHMKGKVSKNTKFEIFSSEAVRRMKLKHGIHA